MVVKSLGKATLIAAGVGYGLLRGLRALEHPPAEPRVGFEARLDELERVVIRLEQGARRTADTRPQAGFVTHEELAATIDRANAGMRSELERKFETQNLAVGSLRAMISQTDVLLQKVLERLESSRQIEHSARFSDEHEPRLVHRVT